MGNEEKVLAMPAEKLVSLLVAKAERKGRTEAEVYEIIRVLMGYEKASLEQLFAQKADYRTFLLSAPSYDPGWENVKGTVCGIRVESIENELIRALRESFLFLTLHVKLFSWKQKKRVLQVS